MVRLIDSKLRAVASQFRRFQDDVDLLMRQAASALSEAGHDPLPAARVAATSSWWRDRAEDLVRRLDRIETASSWNSWGFAELLDRRIRSSDGRVATSRRLILEEIDALDAERARLARRLDIVERVGEWLPSGAGADLRSELTDRIAALDLKLADRRRWAGGSIWQFDSAGDGRIVEVFGDLEHADHVAVLIPGVGNDLDRYERSLVPSARHLLASSRPARVAVVAWLDYDPPDSIVTALGTGPAVEGARTLSRFLRAVRATAPAGVHVTTIGHSYGSLVLGLAIRDHGVAPDEVVFVGSPGVGAARVDELPLPGRSRVWVGLADGDPIDAATIDCLTFSERCPVSDEMVFGTNPAAPTFGATRFDAGGAPFWHAHSSYFDEGSVSLENLARIVVGDDDAVTMQ